MVRAQHLGRFLFSKLPGTGQVADGWYAGCAPVSRKARLARGQLTCFPSAGRGGVLAARRQFRSKSGVPAVRFQHKYLEGFCVHTRRETAVLFSVLFLLFAGRR